MAQSNGEALPAVAVSSVKGVQELDGRIVDGCQASFVECRACSVHKDKSEIARLLSPAHLAHYSYMLLLSHMSTVCSQN